MMGLMGSGLFRLVASHIILFDSEANHTLGGITPFIGYVLSTQGHLRRLWWRHNLNDLMTLFR